MSGNRSIYRAALWNGASVRLAALLLGLMGACVSTASAGLPARTIATGDWSEPSSDSRGRALRGRLVLCEKPRSDMRQEVVVYVELQDASDSIGNSKRLYCDFSSTNLQPENQSGLRCVMKTRDNALVSAKSFPFGGGIPGSEWITLPTDASIRLRATPFGIHRENAMAISSGPGTLWVIDNADTKEYFLSGTLIIDPPANVIQGDSENVWRGTISLPAVRIINDFTPTLKAEFKSPPEKPLQEIFRDANYRFAGHGYGANEFTPSFYAYHQSTKQWIRISKVSTRNSIMGRSPDFQKVPLSVGWDHSSLSSQAEVDFPLITGAVLLPDKIEFDCEKQAYRLSIGSKYGEDSHPTSFVILKRDLDAAFAKVK